MLLQTSIFINEFSTVQNVSKKKVVIKHYFPVV